MEEINIKDLINYIMSKYYIIIILILAVLLIGNIYSLFIKVPMYNGTTTLVLVSDANAQSITQSDVQLNNNLVATYTEIIKSKNILNKVNNNLNLGLDSNMLLNKLSVTSTANTQLISITVSDEDKKLAVDIANEIAKVFITETREIYKLDNVHIVDEALINDKPYNKNIIKENIIYLLIGIISSIGIILLMYTLDTTIKSASDIEEKLELTVLGAIPKVGDRNGK